MGMVTRGAGAGAGAGSSPKGSGAGQVAKADGAGLGCGGTGRALGALARLSTGSGELFLEAGVLIGSRANGALATSSVEAPSSRTAALSEGEGEAAWVGAAQGRLSRSAIRTPLGQPGPAPALGPGPTRADPKVVPGSLGS